MYKKIAQKWKNVLKGTDTKGTKKDNITQILQLYYIYVKGIDFLK